MQRPDGRWVIQFRYLDQLGDSRRTTVYGATQAEVRGKAKAIRARLNNSQPPTDAKISLAIFTKEWISSTLAASDRKLTTKSLYETIAHTHIAATKLGKLSLEKISPAHIDAWLVELRDGRGLSESSCRQAYTVLRAILNAAVRDRALASNPVLAVKRPGIHRVEAHHLEPGQIAALFQAAAGSRYLPLFELLAATGMRRGEALALTWDDIDSTKGLIHVRGTLSYIRGELVTTTPKTARSRRSIPISAAAAAALSALRLQQKKDRLAAGSLWHATPYVVTSTMGTACDPRNALRAFTTAAHAAGLGPVSLHTLRHSAATIMLEGGVPLTVVSRALGHSSVAITGDIYGHVSPDMSRSALDILSVGLGEA